MALEDEGHLDRSVDPLILPASISVCCHPTLLAGQRAIAHWLSYPSAWLCRDDAAQIFSLIAAFFEEMQRTLTEECTTW